MEKISNIPERGQWANALLQHPSAEIETLGETLTANYAVRHLALPQSGLGLLKMRDGAYHEPYFLGEIPVTRAHVELRAADGKSYQGGVQVMIDSTELAAALAVCDAVLANRLQGWESVAQRVRDGRKKIAQVQEKRRAMLARTLVDFALLGEQEDDDED